MPDTTHESPWWDRGRHADRRGFLLARNRIQEAFRRWFREQGFLEIDPALLQVSPGNETHLHAFDTELIGSDGKARPLYLSTSPEFACKKLLAAGEERIFTFAPSFRNRERGVLHHPQFTMLEWYRATAPYETLMDDCGALLALAADTTGIEEFRLQTRHADPRARPERLTVAEAFNRIVGVDIHATFNNGECDRDAFAAAAHAAGIKTAEDDTWADIFSRILVAKVEPSIGNGCATLLTEYPAHLAALARRKPGDARVAERFELYACGVELANAFGELTDPVEQRRRLEAEMAEKKRIYGERYPIDDDFIAALAHMPPSSGAALGFDRLVMLATGATHIDQVLWTPVVE